MFGDLTITPLSDPPAGTIGFAFSGKSNDRQPSRVLDPYFQAALDEAWNAKATLELHVEKVDHMNSSTITAIIGLVQKARARATRLVIVFDKAQKWQKLSCDALRVLGKGDGMLEVRGI